MLKDKYRFKLQADDAYLLHTQIQEVYNRYGYAKDLEVKLPLAVLMDFQKRLIAALLFPEKEIKIYLKRTEALAFQLLYMGNMIDTTYQTIQVAHAIDVTL